MNEELHYHTFFNGLPNLLKYADRNSMHHSVEVRLPFLDHKFVEFLFSLPTSYKINEGWTKWILRKSYEDKIPAEIMWKKEKIGYAPPKTTSVFDNKFEFFEHYFEK